MAASVIAGPGHDQPKSDRMLKYSVHNGYYGTTGHYGNSYGHPIDDLDHLAEENYGYDSIPRDLFLDLDE